MQPFIAGSFNHVLTIDIPKEWNSTGSDNPQRHAGGAIFRFRTGCRFDVSADIAQCETGGSGGAYDVSAKRVGGLPIGPLAAPPLSSGTSVRK